MCTWLPSYLILPWYSDTDVFATLAHGWDAGLLPYRDLAGDNFPGAIYLFWCLGKVFGWGCVRALYVTDAALLVLLIATLIVWSRSRFGSALPGLVGCLMVLSYYLCLDFSEAAQRDWHAPLLAVVGLLVAQTWPERPWGVLAAVLGVSAGFLIRPQIVLLLPALVAVIVEFSRRTGASWGKTAAIVAAWMAVFAAVTLLGFLPLVRAGIFGDFVRGVSLVAYGGDYNRKTAKAIMSQFIEENGNFRVLSVLISVAVLSYSAQRPGRQPLAVAWLVALAGVLFYSPLSPSIECPHLCHPLWMIWSVNVAVLVALILESPVPPRWQFLCVLLVLGLGATVKPLYCQALGIRDSVAALYEGRELVQPPMAYRMHPLARATVRLPPWHNYLALLDHLRHKTAPGTRVASLLTIVAVTGPAGRLPAFPAESATWLRIVKPSDEARFAQTLEQTPDSVVVWWSPEAPEDPLFHRFPKLEAIVRRLYRPEARFGDLEVWRRRP
jgi:hypothetical protein